MELSFFLLNFAVTNKNNKTMNYQEAIIYRKEKERIHEVAINFMKSNHKAYVYPTDKGNVLDLVISHRHRKVTINHLWLNEFDEVQVNSSVKGMYDKEYDMLTDFTNDEMKEIIKVCEINLEM